MNYENMKYEVGYSRRRAHFIKTKMDFIYVKTGKAEICCKLLLHITQT